VEWQVQRGPAARMPGCQTAKSGP